MEKEVAFHILEIKETKDEGEIRAAYMKVLKVTNPEDDQAGFQRLRQAYETALEYAKTPDENDSAEGAGDNSAAQKTKNEVDFWIDRVGELYQDITKRGQVENWAPLLSDPICVELDTALEAQEKMLVFLMNHVHLPHAVWEQIDEALDILENMESLKDKFPSGFLKYIDYYINHETFIPFEYFSYLDETDEAAKQNGDSYLDGYFAVKGKVDRGEPDFKMQEIDDLRAFGLYHPYEDAERLRLLNRNHQTEEGLAIADTLLEQYKEDSYVCLYVGETYWEVGRIEDAYVLWQEILTKHPDHYAAKFNIARYLYTKEDYVKARELVMELFEISRQDDQAEKLLTDINEALIKEYQSTTDQTDKEQQMKLAWCLFQNSRYDETLAVVEALQPSEEQEYTYCNLYGRLLFQLKRYREAIPHLEQCIGIIRETVDDSSKENQKRIKNHFRICYFLSAAYYECEEYTKAEEIAREGTTAVGEREDHLECLRHLAAILTKMKQYERAIDVCDELLKEEEQYYPAYLIRQEACQALNKNQEVVDDYHRAVDIYGGYYMPYLRAAEVFIDYGQYEDAKSVFDKARENEVEFSAKMKLFEVRTIRNLEPSEEDKKHCMKVLQELNAQPKEDSDIEERSQILFEMARLHMIDSRWDEAIAMLDRAVAQGPERAVVYYNLGVCYENKKQRALAMEKYERTLILQKVFGDACEKLSDYYSDLYEEKSERQYFDKAIMYINRQLEEIENCYYLVHRGLIYMDAFELDLAIADFEKAIEYIPQDWAAHNNLGCCYKYRGLFDKAIEYLEKANEFLGDEKNPLPYSNMADCYAAKGEYEKAINCYEKALKLDERQYFWKEIGALYCAMGRYREALRAYENTRAREDYTSNMGSTWIRLNDIPKGISYYKAALEAATQDSMAQRRYKFGEVYMEQLQDYRKAVKWFKGALAATYDEDDLFDYEQNIARCYYMMGKYKKAKKHAEYAMEHFQKSGRGTEEEYLSFLSRRPVRLATFGWVHLCLGDRERAIQYFNEMDTSLRCRLCTHPRCFESNLYLGYIYEREGNTESAMKQFEEALNRNPDDYESRSMIEKLKRMKK